MASKRETRQNQALTSEEIDEWLIRLGKLIDRLKVMYEQYFMGIQKTAPAQLHKDADRQIRELTQINIRNTALRFRFATIKQKFGAYNTYWKRTLRQIEQGTYLPHIHRVARKARRTGEEIPDEILAAMPKRVRERILRDRERMVRIEERRRGSEAPPERAAAARPANAISDAELGAFDLMDAGDDFDLDDAFAAITAQAEAAVSKHAAAPAPKLPPKPMAAPAPKPMAAPAPKPMAAPAKPMAAPAPRPPKPASRGVLAQSHKTARPPPRPAPKPAPPTQPPPRPAPPPIPKSSVRPPPPPPMPKRPARPAPAPAPSPTAAAKASPIPGMTEAQTRDLHARYNKGRKMVGEGDPVSYEKLMRTLQRQAPKILEQHGAKGVEFNVAIKNDRVILKAKPKK